MSDFIKRFIAFQNELKAPKSQYNSFGKYNYRSAEDILEAVKPLEAKHNILIFVSDDVELCGNRIYVKATATAVDANGESEPIKATAFARESETKKGMDDSQITGTASSYARKYALNGLLCIDDTKDADTDQYRNQQDNPAPPPQQNYQQQNNFAPPPQQNNPAPPIPVCADCGQPFAGCNIKGKLYDAYQVAQMASQMSPDSLPRCKACREKGKPKVVSINDI